MKKFILLTLLVFTSLLLCVPFSFSKCQWRMVSSNLIDSPDFMDWSQKDPVYDPERDDIGIFTVETEKQTTNIKIWRFRDMMWNKKTQTSLYPYSGKYSTSLYDETSASSIPLWDSYYLSDNAYIAEFRGFNMNVRKCLGRGYYYGATYGSINLEPGKFIFSIDENELSLWPDGSNSRCYLFSDGEIHINDQWQSDWAAAPMVWDENRNVVVKYGYGQWGAGPCFENYYLYESDNRLREWDGTTWTLRLDVHDLFLNFDPSPFYIIDNNRPGRYIRMVYNEATGYVILYSELALLDFYLNTHYFRHTWKYDGKSWKAIDISEVSKQSCLAPKIIYDTAHNRTVLFRFPTNDWGSPPPPTELWYLEDDASTQTYSRRNVMEEGCEPRTWGETGVDCSFTSSTSWSRIIVVKTEDETAPRIGDIVTSGIWAADVLWEIKTDRPPDIDASETTGTLISISYTPEIVDRICSDTSKLQLFIARPDEAIGVPISDALPNDMRSFEEWQTLPLLDHPPSPGEHGVFHDMENRRFLFRCVMEPPFYGSPAGLPREDCQPASLCYAIGTTDPDFPQMIKSAILGRAKYTEEERTLLDQNADARLDIADLIHILGQ